VPHLNLSKKEQIIALAQSISIIEALPDRGKDFQHNQQSVVQFMQRVQRDLREEIIMERECKAVQTSIVGFFKRQE